MVEEGEVDRVIFNEGSPPDIWAFRCVRSACDGSSGAVYDLAATFLGPRRLHFGARRIPRR